MQNHKTKKIILCADDYAQNSTITQGILNLVSRRRLSAVSCLTTSSDWPAHAALLSPYHEIIDIGLHFNLTEGCSLSKQNLMTPLAQLLLKAFLGRIDERTIETEFHAQLDRFIEHMGKIPDFIDGHQHIHHFPIIRDAILNGYQKRFPKRKIYIRIASNSLLQSLVTAKSFPKSQIITATGALTLKKKCQQLKIPCNDSFAGIYAFKKAANYRFYFPYFLSQMKNNGLIMCHPGLPSEDAADLLRHSREKEYNYFNSDEFIEACAAAKVSLGRYALS